MKLIGILFYSSVFYGLIIGRNRETLKNLEYQTKTRIKIPGPKDNKIISKYNIRKLGHLILVLFILFK